MPTGVWCEPSHPIWTSYLSNGVAHILVNSIGHLCSLHTSSELHVQDTGVVSQPPVISFVASQSGTVDARLLACTDADNLQSHTSATAFSTGDMLTSVKPSESYLSVFSIADRIGLGVFESDGGHCEVTDSLFRELITNEGETVGVPLC